MHPGLADLVGRVLEFELQTKIRGPSFWSGLLVLCEHQVEWVLI